jgi:hypothetical protein
MHTSTLTLASEIKIKKSQDELWEWEWNPELSHKHRIGILSLSFEYQYTWYSCYTNEGRGGWGWALHLNTVVRPSDLRLLSLSASCLNQVDFLPFSHQPASMYVCTILWQTRKSGIRSFWGEPFALRPLKMRTGFFIYIHIVHSSETGVKVNYHF